MHQHLVHLQSFVTTTSVLTPDNPFTPGRKPCACQYPLPCPPRPPPLAATQLLHPRGLTCPGLCSGRNHTDGSLCPAAFTQHSVCKAHLCCHMTSTCLLFHRCIIVHCVNRRQAFKISCPLMDIQVVSIFWPLAICCHKHSHPRFYADVCFLTVFI